MFRRKFLSDYDSSASDVKHSETFFSEAAVKSFNLIFFRKELNIMRACEEIYIAARGNSLAYSFFALPPHHSARIPPIREAREYKKKT